jgi:hypothetical protein
MEQLTNVRSVDVEPGSVPSKVNLRVTHGTKPSVTLFTGVYPKSVEGLQDGNVLVVTVTPWYTTVTLES